MILQTIYREILDELTKDFVATGLITSAEAKRTAWNITQKLHESADKTPNRNFTPS